MQDLSASPLARMCTGCSLAPSRHFPVASCHRRVSLRFIPLGKGGRARPFFVRLVVSVLPIFSNDAQVPLSRGKGKGKEERGRRTPKAGEPSWLQSPSPPPADFKNRKGKKKEESTDFEADIGNRKKLQRPQKLKPRSAVCGSSYFGSEAVGS